jgi:putative membrane protein
MNAKKLVKKLRLSDGDFAAIESAVRQAELRTNGEIALAATSESSDYSFHELLASVILGALAFAAMIPLYGQIAALIGRMFWHESAWFFPAFYGAACFAVIAIFFLIANIPAIDRLIIPAASRRRAVYYRALRHFVESGVYSTKERNGILIFISYMEREVRIIADVGISSKIGQDEWDAVAKKVAEGVGTGKLGDALVDAVGRCGELLAKHFPAEKENPNELADGLVILGGRE